MRTFSLEGEGLVILNLIQNPNRKAGTIQIYLLPFHSTEREICLALRTQL